MIDSCSARKVDPGLAAMYSIPSDLMTSSMKSDPGLSVVYTSARGGGGLVSAAARAALGSGVTCRAVCVACAASGCAIDGFATNAAAPAAAPFKNPRRLTEAPTPFFDLAIV